MRRVRARGLQHRERWDYDWYTTWSRLRRWHTLGASRRARFRLASVPSDSIPSKGEETGNGADMAVHPTEGGGHGKSKNYQTNPNLAKPAWKIVPGKAKNEPKLKPSVYWENFWAKGQGDNVLGEFGPGKAVRAVWAVFDIILGRAGGGRLTLTVTLSLGKGEGKHAPPLPPLV